MKPSPTNPQHKFASDPEFIPSIGKHPDWIALTHDSRQRYNADERDAVMRSRVPLFIHVGHLRHSELAASFILLAPKMIAFREKHAPPFIAKLHRPEKKSPYLTVRAQLECGCRKSSGLPNRSRHNFVRPEGADRTARTDAFY